MKVQMRYLQVSSNGFSSPQFGQERQCHHINPSLLLELANDENVILRNFAINAVEANIVKLSQDNRVFTWATNGKKLMTVPFDENPYSAMAVWFQTDEGLEVYKSIEKKLK